MTFGAPEILIIVGILILLFGAKKIPELARGIGQGIKEFKNATDDDTDPKEVEDNSKEPSSKSK